MKIIGKWNSDKGAIPNQEGFKLRVRLLNGYVMHTEVVKNLLTGCHFLPDIKLSTVAAWQEVVW